MHSHPLPILLCFIAVGETVNALYFFGQNYSKCMHKNTNTTVLLECAPGNDWTYTDCKPDATEHLLGVLPSPLTPCVVCYFVLGIIQTSV